MVLLSYRVSSPSQQAAQAAAQAAAALAASPFGAAVAGASSGASGAAQSPSSSGSIWIDASVAEQHGAQAQVTEHQIESGASVNDYVRPMPRHLSLTSFVSNTPVYGVRPALPGGASTNLIGEVQGPRTSSQTVNGQSFKTLSFDDERDRAKEVFEALVSVCQAGGVFDIYTSLATYQNMVLTNLSAPRDAEHGNAIQFQLDFQEIRVVDSQEVTALPPKVSRKSKGSKSAKEVDPNSKDGANRTAAFNIGHSLGAW